MKKCVSCHAERTLALLAFPDASTSPVADLMDVSHRQKTASHLNAVILKVQGQVVSRLKKVGVS